MPRETPDTRVRGIELGELPEKLGSVTFPIEKAELLDAVGRHEIEFQNAETSTLDSVIGPAGVDWFRSYDDLVATVSQMVGREAVGQAGRTGRGTSHLTPPDHQRPAGRPADEETSRTF